MFGCQGKITSCKTSSYTTGPATWIPAQKFLQIKLLRINGILEYLNFEYHYRLVVNGTVIGTWFVRNDFKEDDDHILKNSNTNEVKHNALNTNLRCWTCHGSISPDSLSVHNEWARLLIHTSHSNVWEDWQLDGWR